MRIVVPSYAVDPQHTDGGVPVNFGGLTLYLVSDFSPRMRDLKKYQAKKYRPFLLGSGVDVPAEIEDQIDVERASAAVTNWEGAVDEQGQAVPFSREAVAELFQAEPFLRRDVLYAIAAKETFRRQDLAALGKDSSPPSSPS